MLDIKQLKKKIRDAEIKEAEATGALKTIKEELKDDFGIESQAEIRGELGRLEAEEQTLQLNIGKLQRKIEKLGI